jgi:putative secretion ATPase (PEP-CTERM system associated)
MYDKFYSLTGMPFRLSPDPRFLYQSRAHTKALAYLRYGLQLGEGFMVVTGDIGTGKTTLARSLVNKLENSMGTTPIGQNIIAAQLVTSQLESDDLLRMVCNAFGLPSRDLSKSALITGIEKFLRDSARAGKRVLLLVDEVQNLPTGSLEELRMLSNFQVGERALLQCFLLGQEEFRATMQAEGMEQFRQRIIAAYHLGPMDAEDTRKYIEHRLRTVDWKNDPHFTDDAIDAIYHYTQGVPRRINSFCDRLMLYGALEELHELNKAAVDCVIGEQQLEIPRVDPPSRAEESDTLATDAPSSQGREIRLQLATNTVSDAERRLAALERRVEALEAGVKKDREKLRKLIMISLLSDEEDDLNNAMRQLRNSD